MLDVAVIGAGVSGAYAAWRLLGPEAKHGPVLKELRRRLFSVTPPGMPHLHADLGGMRHLNNQPVIADLVDHLGLGHGSVAAKAARG
ncbi:hypothetical protein ACFRLW_19320 [Streptomyces sp. NPDC056728]